MSCHVTRSSSHPQSYVPTKSRFAPFTAVPRSSYCLLKRSILGLLKRISANQVFIKTLAASHFGASVLRHQTAGSQPGGSESPLSSGGGYNEWIEQDIMYIYATSIYVHTMLYWNIHYVLLQYGIGVYIYVYIYIYTYYNMYGECK